jgi:hypothetical protein
MGGACAPPALFVQESLPSVFWRHSAGKPAIILERGLPHPAVNPFIFARKFPNAQTAELLDIFSTASLFY